MKKRPVSFCVFAVVVIFSTFSSLVGAGQNSWDLPTVGPYGVAVTPGIYLVNFSLLYISNPNLAANMPAYRTPIPLVFSDCLEKNPQGCPYSAFARFFGDKPFPRSKSCSYPTACQANSKWERLAPGIARRPSQLNEPLGLDRANKIARSLGIDKGMILTDWEYQCMIGTPADRDEDQDTIVTCVNNLTNSNGTTNIPLSSYGLSITQKGDAQSDCAPEAPCLVFNDLFAGPLEKIAIKCGFEEKLDRMVRETSFPQLIENANGCQQYGIEETNGACIVEPVCSSSYD